MRAYPLSLSSFRTEIVHMTHFTALLSFPLCHCLLFSHSFQLSSRSSFHSIVLPPLIFFFLTIPYSPPPSSLPPPHLARTLQFSLEELVPSSIPIDAASSFPYKQLGLYGILTRASTLCIVHKYICIVYMLLLCLRNHIILDIVPHRECTVCTLLFKSISNEYACKRCVYTDEC